MPRIYITNKHRCRKSVSSGETPFLPEETSFAAVLSGQTGFSPDVMTFPSWKSLRFGQMENGAGGKGMSGHTKTLIKFTLAANVPQNAYIDTPLPR